MNQYVIVGLGCIECGAGAMTDVEGPYDWDMAMSVVDTKLDRINKSLPPNRVPFGLTRREDAYNPDDEWSDTLRAQVDGAGWAIQVHELTALA